jgi:hypothetical protein
MTRISRTRRLVAVAAGATLSLGLFAGTAHALTAHHDQRITIPFDDGLPPHLPPITIPPDITIDPCVFVPEQCTPPTLPPPVTVPPPTSPPTTDPGTTDTSDPVPPASHAPVVQASPNFTG